MEVLDDEYLLRLTFAPEHFVNGQFQQGAISLQDLTARGVSVDRTSITSKETVLQRVEAQAVRFPLERELPVYSLLHCADVRAESDEDGQPLFVVQEAIVAGNDGHALIYSRDRSLGKGALRKLRGRLLEKMADSLVGLEEVFPDI